MVSEKSKRRCLQYGLFRAIIIYLYHKVDVSSVLIRSALPFKLKSLWRQAAMILLISEFLRPRFSGYNPHFQNTGQGSYRE